jgi:putative ABC transport system permease protein
MSERIAASPGVTQVGVISVAPLSGLLRTVPFSVAGQASAERDRSMANLRVISPGYLAAVNTRLLRGRHFAESDTAGTPPVAIVSATLADRLLPGEAVGQRLMIFDNSKGLRPVEIVGVVEPVHHTALDLPPAIDIYVPLRQAHPDGLRFLRDNQFWLVRTDADPDALRATFLAHLRAVDADAAVSGAGAMRRFVEESLGPRRFNLGLFGAFASTTLLLAVVGLYGLVSYTVSQRTQEIGLRMAIGASQRDVLRMILREALTHGIAGVLAGLGVAVAARRFVAATMPSLSAAAVADGMVAMITALSMIAVVLLAAWVPARRASRIDPTTALRA